MGTCFLISVDFAGKNDVTLASLHQENALLVIPWFHRADFRHQEIENHPLHKQSPAKKDKDAVLPINSTNARTIAIDRFFFHIYER